MKALKLALCAATASFAMAGAASAQTVSFNVGVASDYVFRGISQTDENVQVFGGVDLTQDIFYAGAWVSNVDFGDGTDAEFDLYAGFKPTLGAVTLDFGAIYYGYINEPSGADWAQWEIKAAASVPAGPFTLGAAAYYSPDYTGVGSDESLYLEANAAISPADKWTISAAIGNQEVDFGGTSFDYTTYNIGIGYAFTEKVSADLRFHDSDAGCGSICDERVAVSLKAVLP
ncbi:MAG: TorF family putative porin [Caulobacter sp.]|nr:TorF family putative porin [Caulobacter sp.]